jgi:Helix-turn-helix domain
LSVADLSKQLARGYKTYRRGEPVGFVPALDRLAVRQISNRYLSEEERIGIADLRRSGLSIRKIADKLGPSGRSRTTSRIKSACLGLRTDAQIPVLGRQHFSLNLDDLRRPFAKRKPFQLRCFRNTPQYQATEQPFSDRHGDAGVPTPGCRGSARPYTGSDTHVRHVIGPTMPSISMF